MLSFENSKVKSMCTKGQIVTRLHPLSKASPFRRSCMENVQKFEVEFRSGMLPNCPKHWLNPIVIQLLQNTIFRSFLSVYGHSFCDRMSQSGFLRRIVDETTENRHGCGDRTSLFVIRKSLKGQLDLDYSREARVIPLGTLVWKTFKSLKCCSHRVYTTTPVESDSPPVVQKYYRPEWAYCVGTWKNRCVSCSFVTLQTVVSHLQYNTQEPCFLSRVKDFQRSLCKKVDPFWGASQIEGRSTYVSRASARPITSDFPFGAILPRGSYLVFESFVSIYGHSFCDRMGQSGFLLRIYERISFLKAW